MQRRKPERPVCAGIVDDEGMAGPKGAPAAGGRLASRTDPDDRAHRSPAFVDPRRMLATRGPRHGPRFGPTPSHPLHTPARLFRANLEPLDLPATTTRLPPRRGKATAEGRSAGPDPRQSALLDETRYRPRIVADVIALRLGRRRTRTSKSLNPRSGGLPSRACKSIRATPRSAPTTPGTALPRHAHA